jgi:membrane protein
MARGAYGTARVLAAIDTWQRSHAAAAVPVAVLKKFGDDRASSLAALMAYYAFFSLFPLLLVFVSVLGFVLEDDPSLQADIVDRPWPGSLSSGPSWTTRWRR